MSQARELADVVSAAPSTDFNVDNGVLVVDASENRVGIGSTSPTTTLDVNGNIKIADAGTIGSATAANAITIASNGVVTLVDDLKIKDGGTIGSATTADAITIAANGQLTLSNSPAGFNYAATVAAAQTDSTDGIVVANSGTAAAAITVAHADTSSQASVNNSGTSFIQDITLDTYGHITALTSATVTNPTLDSLGIDTDDDVRFDSFGVGTAASGTTGEIRATNNITAYYSSDLALKENISPISNALEKIDKISGVSFDWSDDFVKDHGGEDGYFVRKKDVGVIAQEIQKVLPEVVAERPDGTLAVKYDRIIPLLIQAIKELKNGVS